RHHCLPSGLAPLRALAGSFASSTPGVIEPSERVAARLFGSNLDDAWSHLAAGWFRMATSCRRLIWKPIQASRIRESSERVGAYLPSPLPPVCPEHLRRYGAAAGG